MNASISKSFFERRSATLSLLISDLFDSSNEMMNSVSELRSEEVRSSRLPRYALLTFTYQFQFFESRVSSK
jgi:hypothetical protein